MGPRRYSNEKSWYEAVNARTAIGMSRDGRMLTLVAVDARGGSLGMTVRELADVLVRDYDVWQALNLDGGGSASLVVTDPETNEPRLRTVSADGPAGRAVGSSLLVFATRATVGSDGGQTPPTPAPGLRPAAGTARPRPPSSTSPR